ncbi:MAG: hypothetical protein CSB44_10355 [Gammaproteobacteria bacterium]|nr:MAG: hypothetical protein CSB44_10355 [Gammaproteobacteria bacterium]
MTKYHPVLSVVAASVLLAGCPWDVDDDDHALSRYIPVYMSYDELRESVVVTEAEEIDDTIDRVYLYDSWIFLVDTGKGIHVLDNRDPTAPKNTAYVEVPGSTEISIRDGYIFVDSFVDLVTLDARNPEAVIEVDREVDIFPYDPYQVIDDDVYFSDVDESRGVVVGYRN